MTAVLLAALPASAVIPAFAAPPPTPPPPAVEVEPVVVKNMAPVDTFVGQVQAIQSVNIIARVQAYLDKVAFQDGTIVKPGQLLFELQTAPYEAALLKAQGNYAQAQATLANAQKNLERDTKAGSLAISEQQVQQDKATRDEAEGQLAAAKGALQTAQLDLSYCTITAPIGGRIGRAQVTEGNLVGPTTGTLATIVQTNPIRVFFNIPDNQLLTMEKQAGDTREQFIAQMQLELTLADGKDFGQKGKIEFLNNQVDTGTGTLTAWGRFDNQGGALIPGAYVTVKMQVSKPEERPLVPVQAVQNDAQGQFVLLVDSNSKVQQQRVTLGRQVGQTFIVDSGLKGGERVITEGVQKVHPGEVVQAATPAPSAADEGAGGAAGAAPADGG